MGDVFDHEGFLLDPSMWTEDIACHIAATEGVVMTEAHWQVVRLARRFYEEFDMSPNMRPLVNYVKLHLGPECGNSMYLMRLFHGSPAKLTSKIAGLPKPSHCL
ncbi:MAG TPA: TusE/DsrC/DsvC family sulfur relay protein [Pseudomonadales bacterium]|nr:TusE/DsrC/DsvC family sulfur relay protein [Pseudomonadales bacterium]